MKTNLVYLQQVWFTTSKYGKLQTGKITAIGKNLFTINGKHVYRTDSMKEKDLTYASGKCYLKEQDYYDEKEYEKNSDFLRSAFSNIGDKLTLEQTRKIIEIMSEVREGA